MNVVRLGDGTTMCSTCWAREYPNREEPVHGWVAGNCTFHTDAEYGELMDYDTADEIRDATCEEREASIEAAKTDGGAGVIVVDGVHCYVQGGAE